MKNVAVAKYYSPEEFDKIKKLGLNLGFRFIFAGPFVRSSYLAEEVFETCKR
jgi:lipoic acid synthetase